MVGAGGEEGSRPWLRQLLGQPCGLTEILDQPEVLTLLHDGIDAGGYMPRRHREAGGSRADLLPLPAGEQDPLAAAVEPSALATKVGHRVAGLHPTRLQLVERSAPCLVVGDALQGREAWWLH